MQAPVVQKWYERSLCCKLVVLGVIRASGVRIARYAQPDRVRCVVPIDARCAGRDHVLSVVLTERLVVQDVIVWRCGRRMRVAAQTASRDTEHIVPADRFAREIVGFLIGSSVRARGG